MALFTDPRYDKDSGRHYMLFINQQMDPIMSIFYDESIKAYRFGDKHEAVIHAAASWGWTNFDPEKELKECSKALQELDAKKQKK